MPSVRPFVLAVAAALLSLAAGCAAPVPARALAAPTARPAPPVDPIDTGEDTGLARPR